jgi:hypothetical protein
MTETSGNVLSEIEITPEMIEAGEEAYGKTDDRFDTPREIVRSIYLAMHAAFFDARATNAPNRHRRR